jgi:serine-type D-Ala-D-Ala carboxypeptidase
MNRSDQLDMDRLRVAASIADTAVRDGSHSTAIIAVADRRDVLWTHTVPGADEAALDSIFLVASLTKPIIASAIMRLVERGHLLLDLPVATYIPEFGSYGKENVTTWHLLTHTSGLEEARWEAELARQGAPAAAYLEAACRSYLHFEPGTRFEYCSLSFWVLGELITRLSGTPYPEVLQMEICAPLGMRDTGFAFPDPERAVAVHDFGGPERTRWFCTLAAPGGGLWSTAADLLAFGQTMLNSGRSGEYRLLGVPAVVTMTRNHTPGATELVDGRSYPVASGLGWRKPTSHGGMLGSEASFGHAGATGTYLWIDPTWDLVFVFMTNRWGQERDTPRRILNAVYGAVEGAGPHEPAGAGSFAAAR